MHVRARRRLQDAVTAIRHNVPISEAGRQLYPNGERYLRERERLAKLYPRELLEETVAIARRCTFSLEELRYEYPQELVPAGRDADQPSAQAHGGGRALALAARRAARRSAPPSSTSSRSSPSCATSLTS